MEDGRIIQLYYERKEQAIAESDRKYGKLCRRIAGNILGVREDAEECVNDTWYTAWTCVPPQRPRSLGAFLGRITRNLAISRWRRDHARKRYDGMEVLLSELEDCVPAPGTVEEAVERRRLARAVSRWLDGLEDGDRWLFIRRYWYLDSVAAISRRFAFSESKVKTILYRCRRQLRTHLEKEGYML